MHRGGCSFSTALSDGTYMYRRSWQKLEDTMLSKLVEELTRAVSRRGFLGRAASISGAVALAVLGLNGVASAIKGPNDCCNLCIRTPCDYSGCVAEWCWTCCAARGDLGVLWKCSECYSVDPGANCKNTQCDVGQFCTCVHVKCSKATTFGHC